MGTYAVYRLWAGVTQGELADVNHPFIDEVMDNIGGVEKEGVKFVSIGMHGETIGLGVEVKELNWEVEINETNSFDPTICEKAIKVLHLVNRVFKDLSISVTAKLYHHIDLGG
ncbi:MAG: hypothetical protein AAB490_03305 [Patescibacteria group bacterium]